MIFMKYVDTIIAYAVMFVAVFGAAIITCAIIAGLILEWRDRRERKDMHN